MAEAPGFLAVWLCQQNLRRPHWRDAWFFWVPITLLLITLAALCWWFALRGDRAESRSVMGGQLERRLIGGCLELRPGVHWTAYRLARRQSGATARHSHHRPARFCGWRAGRLWVPEAPRLALRPRKYQVRPQDQVRHQPDAVWWPVLLPSALAHSAILSAVGQSNEPHRIL